MTPLWSDLLALANVLIYGGLAILSIKHCRKQTGQRWIRVMQIALGLYWSGLYLYVLMAGQIDYTWFGQTLFRPAFTFTGAVMLAGSLHSWLRSRRG